MGKATRFQIVVAPQARDHLRRMNANQQGIVLDAIQKHLSMGANIQTKNRKRLRPNTVGSWELRVGNIRLYYNIRSDDEPTVDVCAVGVKTGSVVRIAGEVVNL